jgi:hypothetical protein
MIDANAIALTAGCAAALGVSAGMTITLLPTFLAAHRDLTRLRYVPDASTTEEENNQSLVRPLGRTRNSSIVGFYGDVLRHADGSFTRAYHVGLCPTVFIDDLLIENRCDGLARMLAARKPVGTIIQFRLSAGVDSGHAIFKHNDSREWDGAHTEAALLHDGGVRKYATMAAYNLFRQTALTCWVRVPNLSRRIEDQFLPTLKTEIKRNGLYHLPQAVATSCGHKLEGFFIRTDRSQGYQRGAGRV